MRNTLEIQENILNERKRKLKLRGGKSVKEWVDWANDPKNYNR